MFVAFSLLRADSAGQLPSGDIRFARQRAAGTLNWVQERAVKSGLRARDAIGVLVYSDEISGLGMIMVFAHQIPMVLSGPTG